jgi:hypothetical protein
MVADDERPTESKGFGARWRKRRIKRLKQLRERAEVEGETRGEVDRLLGSQPRIPPPIV